MDPPSPPPPPPSSSDAAVPTALSSPPSSSPETQEPQRQSSMPPPPNPNYSIAELPPPSSSSSSANGENKDKASIPVPYSIPPWSEAPSLPFFLEVLKDGAIIDNLDVTEKGAYMFGRIDMCDFILEHPTISRFHAVLQFKGSEGAYLYDLGSTHGTFINKKQIKKKEYMELHVGDVIRFGLSTRLYILQGPEELMLPEADLTRMRYAKDREASLRRAKEEAALADGISWGMREDAVEENEDDLEELTWQNYKGELTEKQQKTREKVLKRMEKIAHMKKEMAAIRAKDIAQGGLTQGQQTQIARNEMRISQILEELESLEETLNDSIRESLGARAGKSRGKHKGLAEDEDEFLSDDDEFYDRTKKKAATNVVNKQSVETADSLLDKKEALLDEIEGKKRLILEEKNKPLQPTIEQDTGDALDAFMTDISSQLVVDRTVQLEKDISSLQAELDRIVYLLKIADPTGESAKKRATASKENKNNELAPPISVSKKPDKSVRQPKKPLSGGEAKKSTPDVTEEAGKESKSDEEVTDKNESKPAIYKIAKPQWLGAVKDREMEVSQPHKQPDTDEGDEFIDYKERKKILESSISESAKKPESDLENAAPGLIVRKKTPAGKAEVGGDHNSRSLISDTAGANTAVEDTVALLLKHKRGIYAAEEEAGHGNHDRGNHTQSGKDNKRPRRVLGPEKPAFLEPHPDLDETWVPPEGQSGDGRTSLNDRLGY